MNTYTITTTHGTLDVDGSSFSIDTDELTGENCGCKVYNGEKVVAYIPKDRLVSITVEERVEAEDDSKATLGIDDRTQLRAIRHAEAAYSRK